MIDDGVHARGVGEELEKVETSVYERERERKRLARGGDEEVRR